MKFTEYKFFLFVFKNNLFLSKLILVTESDESRNNRPWNQYLQPFNC
jgi:hypothetical protein